MNLYIPRILLITAVLISIFCHIVIAQETENFSFRNYQFTFPRVTDAYAGYNEKLKKEFNDAGFTYPPDEIYIRAFKAHNEFEIWVRNSDVDTFKIFKKYDVCALSGALGPKRWEGDRQVPEGYYFISDFNPRSEFHLSMWVSYPNYSDLLLGNKNRPGGDIYIHGGCYTIGCLPMTDEIIKEIYIICMNAKINGQNNIPIHIFPVRFNKAGIGFLSREYGNDPAKHRFWINLKAGFDYFENNKTILPVMYNQSGKYVH